MGAVKQCSRCREVKPLSEFARNRSRHSGRGSYCLPCHRLVQKDWNARNRPRYLRTQSDKNRRRKHGISPDEYAALLMAQEGRCAICGRPPMDRALAVDHNHETNKRRGLLCSDCNLAIGKLGDDPELLRRAAAYLEAYQ